MTTLGPYDYWAIEYGYKEIAPDQEKRELARIAARSSEPLLAYATDEDASFAIDPEANQSDLGGDPLEFARAALRARPGDVGRAGRTARSSRARTTSSTAASSSAAWPR